MVLPLTEPVPSGVSELAPRVQSAMILVYSSFDVCADIDLGECERLLSSSRVGRASLELSDLPHRVHGALELAAAPLHVDVGSLEVALSRGSVAGPGAVRLFDQGTISVVLEIDVAAQTSLSEIAALATELAESKAFSDVARSAFEGVSTRISTAMQGSQDWLEARSYVVILVRELAPGSTVSQIRAWSDLAKLAACDLDGRAMSGEQRDEVLRYTDAYREDDLVVIGSACALSIEPSGSREVADILELARAQMMQLRYYDEQLDGELMRAYRAFDRPGVLRAFYSPLAHSTRRLSRRLVELTKFTERIDNALKVVSDFYLARVYQKAVQRFGVSVLKERVTHKQALITRIHTMLKDEVSMVRSLWLEILIVILILIEIVVSFFPK